MSNNNEKPVMNAYHIEFFATMKQPGTIMLVGENEEAVKELLMKMLAHMETVDVSAVYNIEDIPALKLLKEAQDKAREEQMASSPSADEDEEKDDKPVVIN